MPEAITHCPYCRVAIRLGPSQTGLAYCPACGVHLRMALGEIEVSGEDAEDVARVAERMAGVLRDPTSAPVSKTGQKSAEGAMEAAKDVPRVDFGIVTALPLELEALLCHFDDHTKVTFAQSDTRTYYRGDLGTSRKGSYQVVATLLPRMGNVEAALATNDLIRLWHPRYVLMVVSFRQGCVDPGQSGREGRSGTA